MKYCRFHSPDGVHCGIIESVAGREVITQVATASPDNPFCAEHMRPTATHLPLEETRLLAPVVPSKIICVGRNYRAHAEELGHDIPIELIIFLKPPSAVIGPGEHIVRPRISRRVDYEGELAVVIGRTCLRLREDEDVRPYIGGYTCLNDVTARDLQPKEGQWTRAKGFDTFCPVGPVVSDEPDPWAGVELETRVNGDLRQQGNTRLFIFPLDDIIRYVAQVMTLYPGDLIATGTPAGVGPLKAGDTVNITVRGIGTLSNPVVDE